MALAALALLTSGCASAVYASLHNKLPIAEAGNLKVRVNIATVGGGSFEATGVTTDPVTGQVRAETYHEVIQTGGGSLTIEASKVTLKQPR